jgi:hypothetical protein
MPINKDRDMLKGRFRVYYNNFLFKTCHNWNQEMPVHSVIDG